MNLLTRIQFGLLGFVGSFAPTVIKMYNDLPNIAFVIKWEWGVVVLLYGLLGSLIAIVYPYKQPPSAWQAVLVGVAFPTIVGSAASILHVAGLGGALGGPAAETRWSVIDFLALI